jgi:hypothetical protein
MFKLSNIEDCYYRSGYTSSIVKFVILGSFDDMGELYLKITAEFLKSTKFLELYW